MTQADSDGLPTMGQQAEQELNAMKCVCGQPDTPGVMHRMDAPCYVVGEDPPQETFLDRLKAEHHDLNIKGQKLHDFVNGNPSFAALPWRDRELLMMQRNAMHTYFTILTERIFRAVNPEMAAKADAAAEQKAEEDRRFGQPHHGHEEPLQ